MAISASVDVSATPPTLTVVSDKRLVTVEVTAVGEKTTAAGKFPITIADSSRTWTLKSDDGKTAVYTS